MNQHFQQLSDERETRLVSEGHDSLLRRLDCLFDNPVKSEAIDQVRRIAHYEIGEILGSGGFGIVYRARDTRLDRHVALKIPRLEALLDREKRDRFAAEAMMAARLNHPGIVKVYEADLNGLTPFIASELCDGPNLAEWLEAKNQLPPWRDCLNLVADIADAVQYAHQHQVFHRDLKPANIIVTLKKDVRGNKSKGFVDWRLDECETRLTDFGLAKLIDSAMTETRSSQMMGTPLYMAPEHVELGGQAPPTPEIDIYSLGVVLFELLTGQTPIGGSSYFNVLDNIRNASPDRVRDLRKGLPRDVESICSKCLEKNPQARYSSAAELAEDLRRCADGRPVVGKSAGFGTRVAYWCTRPQRVSTAGWYVISWMLLVAVWMTFNVFALPAHSVLTTAEVGQVVRDLAMLYAVQILPGLWLGWKTLQGKAWALWTILGISMVRIPFLMRAMVTEPVYFSMIYKDNSLFSFVDHSMVLFATIAQLFLCVCGVVAQRKMRELNASRPAR